LEIDKLYAKFSMSEKHIVEAVKRVIQRKNKKGRNIR